MNFLRCNFVNFEKNYQIRLIILMISISPSKIKKLIFI